MLCIVWLLTTPTASSKGCNTERYCAETFTYGDMHFKNSHLIKWEQKGWEGRGGGGGGGDEVLNGYRHMQ